MNDHEHDHSHEGSGHEGHSHGPSLASAGAQHRKPLLIAFIIIGIFFVVEAIAGVLTNSLALLSDAGHMLTDVIGLGMALAAIQLAMNHENTKAADDSKTFGLYRLEILAAFVNALLLFGVAIWVLTEAVQRLFGDPEVLATPMLIVAVLGLIANLIAFWILRDGAEESLNVEGAYLEVLADLLGSVGVIIAAIALQIFWWSWIDPVVAVVVGAWILPRTWRLGRQAVRILIQASPPHIDLAQLKSDLESVATVIDVHDLHVWTLTSGMENASVHLMTTVEADHHQVLDEARELLKTRYGISHATLQVEPADHTGCHEVKW